MARKLKALLFNVFEDSFKEVTINDGLSDYYNYIGCDCIDMPMRYVGNRRYVVACDDEGLMKTPAYVSALDTDEPDADKRAVLVGNLIFLNDTYGGDVKSLTDDDIDYISSHVKTVMDSSHPNLLRRVVDISYYGKEI